VREGEGKGEGRGKGWGRGGRENGVQGRVRKGEGGEGEEDPRAHPPSENPGYAHRPTAVYDKQSEDDVVPTLPRPA